MNYRNAVYNKNGHIDCEIEHPQYGWIPFTCNPDDKGAAFDTKELFDRMVKFGKVKQYVPPTQAELDSEQMELIRIQRDKLLKESDILVLPDRWEVYTDAKRKAISDYRQVLRDLPDKVTDPFNVVWPVKPE